MSLEISNMRSINRTARIVGVLFIIGTIAGILSSVFMKPILGSPDYLIKFSANQSQVLLGALFMLIMAAACASIAIWLYPILKNYSESLALGAVGFRLIEGVFDIVAVISLILLLTLSQEFVKAGVPDSSYFQTIGVLLLAGYNWVGNVPVLLAWCVGALMYYYIFYQTRLIPRWLSAWGLVGVSLVIVASMLVMFRFIDIWSTVQVVLNLPIAVQEMVLAIWLIFKGFNPSAIVSEPIRGKM
jgi:hypothetical protein